MINNHFDLAALVGKQAYHYLLLADNAYRKAEKSNLFDPTLHNPAKCLSLSGSIDSLRREELTYCILAVILFQSMMEKIPVFVPTIGSGMELTKKSKFVPIKQLKAS